MLFLAGNLGETELRFTSRSEPVGQDAPIAAEEIPVEGSGGRPRASQKPGLLLLLINFYTIIRFSKHYEETSIH